MLRGAIFGGKWAAIIAGIFMALLWPCLISYRCLWEHNSDFIWANFSNIVKMVLISTVVAMAVPVSVAAIAGALIMGIGGGLGYREASANSPNEDAAELSSASQQAGTDPVVSPSVGTPDNSG
jgi:hypothetical protein